MTLHILSGQLHLVYAGKRLCGKSGAVYVLYCKWSCKAEVVLYMRRSKAVVSKYGMAALVWNFIRKGTTPLTEATKVLLVLLSESMRNSWIDLSPSNKCTSL